MNSKAFMNARILTRCLVLAGLMGAVAPHAMAADYALTFQGMTFETTAVSSSQLQFTILNATQATGDWAGVQYLEAIDFQSIASATDVSPYTTINPADLSLVDAGLTHNGCSSGDPTGSACFSAGTAPVKLSDNMSWIIDFKDTAGLNFSKPFLKVDFYQTSGQTGATGSLLGQQLQPVSAVPEPDTYAMVLAGLALVGFIASRRKNNSSNLLMAA